MDLLGRIKRYGKDYHKHSGISPVDTAAAATKRRGSPPNQQNQQKRHNSKADTREDHPICDVCYNDNDVDDVYNEVDREVAQPQAQSPQPTSHTCINNFTKLLSSHQTHVHTHI